MHPCGRAAIPAGSSPERSQSGGVLGNGVVAETHAPDDAAGKVVDVTLLVRLDVDVKSHGILAHRLNGVDLGRAVDVARPASTGRPSGARLSGVRDSSR